MPVHDENIDERLHSLKIDRSERSPDKESSGWAKGWILAGIAVFVALGIWRIAFSENAVEVEIARVKAQVLGGSGERILLNAAGYIVPHYKIQLTPKVIGKVAWIGVEKGDRVTKGQVVVRLEDAEFQARHMQSEGNLASLRARLAELEAGSRPEEIALANANLQEVKAELENARVNLERVRKLVGEGVLAEQDADDAQARYDSAQARVESLERTYDLVRIGPRKEVIDATRGQVRQAEGEMAYAQTMLDATLIRAPISGTILERNVEVGEFVTTSFVGERGAKGYVASLADLMDIQVELDISQDDFAKLGPRQRGVITTDAFPDRQYDGEIVEISPEADRQKATVQVKVRILEPDGYLRPEMNANVAFLSDAKPGLSQDSKPLIVVPSSALRDGNSVFVLQGEKAVRREVTVGTTGSDGIEITSGLTGGEDLILNPSAELADGNPVKLKST